MAALMARQARQPPLRRRKSLLQLLLASAAAAALLLAPLPAAARPAAGTGGPPAAAASPSPPASAASPIPPAAPALRKGCGAPGGPCGLSLADTKDPACPPGYCQPGFFCSRSYNWTTNARASSCQPVPKDCGKAGAACCPSNAALPHASVEDQFSRKPSCSDGSSCFFWEPMRADTNADPWAGVTGAYPCTRLPANCGIEGKPCCPSLYHISVNPPLPHSPAVAQLCDRGSSPAAGPGGGGVSLFCDYSRPSEPARLQDGSNWPFWSGTCVRNEADCGKFGQPCCVYSGGSATGVTCGELGPGARPEARGFCSVRADAQDWGKDVPVSQLRCFQCPPDAGKSPDKFPGCRTWG